MVINNGHQMWSLIIDIQQLLMIIMTCSLINNKQYIAINN